jgi:hypothetical protein
MSLPYRRSFLVRSCRLLFCTVSALGSRPLRAAPLGCGVAVVDEAAQLVEAELAIVLARLLCSQEVPPKAFAPSFVQRPELLSRWSSSHNSPVRSAGEYGSGALVCCSSQEGGAPLRLLLLVGDPQQLPATVMSTAAKGLGYARSAFARLQEAHRPAVRGRSPLYAPALLRSAA